MLLVERVVLIVLAVVATGFSACQQFGLLLISTHWFVGWDVWDHIALKTGRNHKPAVKLLHKPEWMRRPRARTYGAFAITLLVVWAELAFVLSPIL